MAERLHTMNKTGFHGPKCWLATLLAGLVLGFILAQVLPPPRPLSPEQIASLKGKPFDEFKADNEAALLKWRAEHTTGVSAAETPREPVHWSRIRPPDISLYLSIPFALLLLAIALMPFIHLHFWERHYPDFAFFLGGLMISYYLFALSSMTTLNGIGNYGPVKMAHVGLEYVQFIALVGSLYVVTGGVLIDVKGRAGPKLNVAILLVGALIANIIGTTGAAALLIRAYIRVNRHRIRPAHIVFFIFIVANCGGCLTPIGDPPLFLGYLQGVPFTWTLIQCWPAWALCVGLLIGIFYILDLRAWRKFEREQQGTQSSRGGALAPTRESPSTGSGPRATSNGADVSEANAGRGGAEESGISISGWHNFLFLGVVLLGVFVDEIFHTHGVGAALQILAAGAAYWCSKKECLEVNQFTFEPVKEVGFLFFGLFATMVPALDYLALNAKALGVSSPSAFYWATGTLSSFLDNAPTYLNFFSAAHGLAGLEIGRTLGTPEWLALPQVGTTGFTPGQILLAISLSSVFFGANTYIGNAPNFMVKTIAESYGVRMPSFFGYFLYYALPIMLPILIVIRLVFV